MFTRRLVPLVIAVLVVGAAAAAAAEDASLELEVSPGSVRVGDRVQVLASARGGGELLWGELTVALAPDGPWALVDGPAAVPGVRPPAWRLELAPLELGELQLPTITVSTRSSEGEAAEVGCSSPPVITVVSVLSGDEEDAVPAPLRDPVGVRGLPWEWVLPVLVLALPLLAGAAWWWRGRGRAGSAPISVLPPFVELERMIGELEARIGREPAEGVCDQLAAGLRRYLERRTGDPAGEMTSFELRLLARRRGWPETAQRLVQQVMGVVDGVRFGRRPVADEELRRAMDRAIEAARTVESFIASAESAPEAAESRS